MVAVLNTLMICRHSSKLSGRSHSDGTVNNCDASRLTFNGFPNTDKKLVAFGSNLFPSEFLLLAGPAIENAMVVVVTLTRKHLG